MNKTRIFLSVVILSFGILVSYSLIAQALSEEDIVYPVAELGNCKNETECRAYCDKPQNLSQCLDFAEEHGLISDEELEMARGFEEAGGEGPGGCTSQESCETYCNDISNMDECLDFAEENGIIPPEELEEARKVQAALAAGAQLPGGCRNKNECETYCENPDHMEECIAFGEAAGFIPPDELEDAHKALEAVRKGAKPPPCRGKRECDSYCSEPENMEACLTFAEAAGFIPPEEVEDAKKMLEALKKGVKPLPCKSREACDNYCSEPEHTEECINFAVAAGFMSAEDAEMAKKTGGKGPGNCKGKEECEAFCDDPANQEVCFNFAKEHGLISEEDLRQMEEGRGKLTEFFNQAPPQVVECLAQRLGPEEIEKLKSGAGMPRDIRSDIESCMAEMGPIMGPPGGMPGGPPEGGMPGMPPGGEFVGPGGCRTPEECQAYCQANPEECGGSVIFEGGEPGQMPGGMMPPGNMMPGGPDQIHPEGSPPPAMSPEEATEFQQQYQQQYQQQTQEQIQQQMMEQQMQQMAPPQEMMPPPPPQSRLNPPGLGEFIAILLLNLLVGAQ